MNKRILPSPLPSPIRWEREKLFQRWIKTAIPEWQNVGQSLSLSPRERAGVRGNLLSPFECVCR
jgi:hypothetical protein